MAVDSFPRRTSWLCWHRWCEFQYIFPRIPDLAVILQRNIDHKLFYNNLPLVPLQLVLMCIKCKTFYYVLRSTCKRTCLVIIKNVKRAEKLWYTNLLERLKNELGPTMLHIKSCQLPVWLITIIIFLPLLVSVFCPAYRINNRCPYYWSFAKEIHRSPVPSQMRSNSESIPRQDLLMVI